MAEIQSLTRGLKILDYIIDAKRSVSITELADALAMDKSTVSRLVSTLVSGDYVQPESGSRRYVPGRRLYNASWQILNRLPVREKARPYLTRLVKDTGECAHTAIYSEGKALVIDDVEGEATLRVAGQTGRRIPLHCTAVGKGLLAFANVPLQDALIARTPHTITDLSRLQSHLDEIRARGYALDDEEYEAGVRCIAAPVGDTNGMAIATIGISGPTVRVTRDRVEPLSRIVMQAAAELSVELGYRAVVALK
jgi:DNA-binding IclR family transcriptional regulator